MRKLAFAALSMVIPAMLPAQVNVTSAKAGLVHYFDGDVELDGKPVEMKKAQFAVVRKESTLETKDGRAEVLLAPGAFLRLGDNSSFRMVEPSLDGTILELKLGRILVEVAEMAKDTSLTVKAGESTVTIRKNGLFAFQLGELNELKVYDGEAQVTNQGANLLVKEGKAVGLATGAQLVATKFDKESGDDLYRWSKRRASYIAMANVSAASMIHTHQANWGRNSAWAYNPYWGMWTFIPGNGAYMSPWGYRFYSPRVAYNYVVAASYAPVYTSPSSDFGGWRGTGAMSAPTYNSSYGYNTMGSRSSGGGGYSGAVAGGGMTGGGAPAGGGDGGGMRGGASGGGGATAGGSGGRGN